MSRNQLNRRQFLKQSAGFVTASVLLPFAHDTVLGQVLFPASDPDPSKRKILVMIHATGGNDGLNTLIPYTDRNYARLRPTIGLRSEDGILEISETNAFHPALSEMKKLYDRNAVAVIQNVGNSDLTLSHFVAEAVWYAGGPAYSAGWLGRAINQLYGPEVGLRAIGIGQFLSPAFRGSLAGVPSVEDFSNYAYQFDPVYTGDATPQRKAFLKSFQSARTEGSLLQQVASLGLDAVVGAETLQEKVATYHSSISYPSSSLARGLKSVAEVITTLPESQLFHLQFGEFDTHARQITSGVLRSEGSHAVQLKSISDAVGAFYRDLEEHGLAEQVIVGVFSEFGRRPYENKSMGTDHGTASVMFLIGGGIKGGVYGEPFDLANITAPGNMVHDVDFRAVYATLLDRWLNVNSADILGGQFENLGFV